MLNRLSRIGRVLVAAALVTSSISPAGAQSAPATPPPDPASTPAVTDHDLDRIRRELQKPDRLNPTLPADFRPTFRVGIEEKFPDIQAWLGDQTKLHGGPMSMPSAHAEFLRMVTPPEATASFTNSELLQVLITGLLGQLALKSGTGAVKNAIASGRSREACQEVRQSLLDLNYERMKAGLPPVAVPECE